MRSPLTLRHLTRGRAYRRADSGTRAPAQVLTETGRRRAPIKAPGRSDRSPFMTGIGERAVEIICGRCEHLLAERIDPADRSV
jgi:hypothetical protein